MLILIPRVSLMMVGLVDHDDIDKCEVTDVGLVNHDDINIKGDFNDGWTC